MFYYKIKYILKSVFLLNKKQLFKIIGVYFLVSKMY